MTSWSRRAARLPAASIEVGPDSADGRAPDRRRLDGHPASCHADAATGEVVGQLGGVLVMSQIDSGRAIVASATRS